MARSRRPKPGVKEFNEGIYHRPPVGLSFFRTGVLALIVLLILTYFAYTKELPWSSPGYTATATFADASTLRETAPVRIAGVNVGEVTTSRPRAPTAKVTFTVDPEGLPLHDDARITIRPRLFLEGNFFLDLRPGSPSAPDLPDGGAIPVTQTATAVQLDQVLALLRRPDRKNLGRLPERLRVGAGRPADAGDGRRHGPGGPGALRCRGGQQELRLRRHGRQELLTGQRGPVGRAGRRSRGLIEASGSVFQQLASRESQLSDLITNFSITTGALAAESQSLQDTLAQLAPTVEQAQDDLPVSMPHSRSCAPSLAS